MGLKITTGGYRARANDLIKSFKNLLSDINEAEIELNVFRHLKEMEDAAIPRRREILEVKVSEKNICRRTTRILSLNLLSIWERSTHIKWKKYKTHSWTGSKFPLPFVKTLLVNK